MRKMVILGLVAGICVVAGILIAFEMDRSTDTAVSSIPVPAVPDTLMVYRISGMEFSEEAAVNLAKKFGVTGPVAQDDCYFYMTNSNTTLHDASLYMSVPKKSGLGIHFLNNTAHNFTGPIDTPENLLSREQAIELSDKFLRENGLYPDGDIIKSISYETRNGTSRDGTGISRREMIIVGYNRTLNGIAVEGDGQQVNVGIVGQPGLVAFYYSQWNRYAPFREFSLKRPGEALNEQKQKGNLTHIPFHDIDRVRLEYFPHSPACGLLEPAYIFESDNITGWVDVVPAPRYTTDPCGTPVPVSAAPPAGVEPRRIFVSATVSPGSAVVGTPFTISGISESQAGKVQVWVFSEKAQNVITVPVSAEGKYSTNFTTAGLYPGLYYVVVQNPGADKEFAITTDGVSGTVINSKTGAPIFNITGPDSRNGISAAAALITAINQPESDDIYTKIQFMVLHQESARE